jgi:hypothetical protein
MAISLPAFRKIATDSASFLINAELTPLFPASTNTRDPIFITIRLVSASKFFRKSLIILGNVEITAALLNPSSNEH